ncbi:MAG: patatin-like phospholipase family protein [Nitrospirae bacterium]|nr:patatin-like phospholipase family protein [Nitrospirota bacterium]
MALVLSGGGFPGWMYEIGCLSALDEFFDDGFTVNDFDIYVGTSAGAGVAALIANHVKPRDIFDAIRENKDSPFNFKSANIYSFGYQETYQLLKKLTKSLVPMMKYLWRNRRWFSVIDMVHLMEEYLPSGIFTLQNFDDYLGSFLSQPGYTNDFRKLKRELYIPAVDVDSGRYDVFGEGEFADVPISKAVTASSAVPIVFQPVQIKGRDYIDGGVGRVAYMDIAINHGASLQFVINPIVQIINDKTKVCLPTLYGACGSIKDKGMSYIFDQGNRISTATRIYLGLKRYQAEHPDKDFLLIQPDPSDALMFLYNVINLAARLEILNYGYVSTVNTLKAQFGAHEKCFAKHGVKVTLKRFR